jgi:predicted nucleotidyltransferase
MPKGSLADALFTATQQRLFGLLFGQPERSFFVTELIDLAGVGRGAVQRELSRLEQTGLLIAERRGNQKHYRANPAAPIFDELCSIVRKTVGIESQIREALAPLAARVSAALIYGSVAKRTDTAKSDIDLLVVADDLTLEDLYSALSAAEQQLGRPINPTLFTAEELAKRRASGNPFLERVLSGPVSPLIGELDAA